MTRLHHSIQLSVIWISLLAFTAGAQQIPASLDPFPPIVNSPSEAHLTPMPAEEATRGWQVPDGFRVQLFAAEPDVQNPIAATWDPQGRLWIAENFTYAQRSQRFDLSMRDRVLILSDDDGDGRADSRRVFTDQVQMLTSLEVGHGGVWLLCPPQLLFIPDVQQDGIPDGPAQVVLDGFDVAQDNYHNFANGLRWGPDGWLYGRCGHSCPGKLGLPGTPEALRVPLDGGIWRYHPQRRTVEVLCHGTTNPWGHDWDQHGELFFINTVIGHLWHMIPGSHFKEPFGESMNPRVYSRMDMIADHYHFDTRGNWTESRDGKANSLGGGHAHVGMMILHAENWPTPYRDRLFTINMHGMRLNTERLERVGSGYVGRHEPDFAIAADPFFRGVELLEGPDGSMVIIDWSDTGECHEHNGVHRTSGRIYRVLPPGKPVSRSITKPWCLAGDGPLHQLWRKNLDGTLDRQSLEKSLDHADEHVRAWGIRLLTDSWPLDWVIGPPPTARYPDEPELRIRLQDLATHDRSGLVRRVLASTLQRLPVSHRIGLAKSLLSHQEDRDDQDLNMLIWYGLAPLADQDPKALLDLVSPEAWPSLTRWMARAVTSHQRTHPEWVDDLLTAGMKAGPEQQSQIVKGMRDATRGWRNAQRPASWSQFTTLPSLAEDRRLIQELDFLFGEGIAMDSIRKLALDDKAPLPDRCQALQTLIEARVDGLRPLCIGLLDVRILNRIAAKGLALDEESESAQLLIKKFKRFMPEDRPAVLEILVSRATFAKTLLDHLAADGKDILASDLQAAHARQILLLNQPSLNQQLQAVWGSLTETTAERAESIRLWKEQLTEEKLAQADPEKGRRRFQQSCAQCHRLFGEGESIGPDITGAQRSNLDYLLSNILDPSAVVGKDYRMTIVSTDDGRVLSGLKVQQSETSITLQTASERITIPSEEIASVRDTDQSAMPDGLFRNLPFQDVCDLIRYLQLPTPLPRD